MPDSLLMNKRPAVLIICYSFPPYPGIGGRRWAKFSKALADSGYNVSVIGAENPFKMKSEWSNDVVGIKAHCLPLRYPKSLVLYPKSLFGRVRYKFDLFFVKLFSNGNYYDRTIFWRRQLLNKVQLLIQTEKISTIIVTAAPFSLLRHVALIKEKHPNLKLIADIRDPWTNNETAYSYNLLSSKRITNEKIWEKTVFRKFNKILSVNQQMTDYFKKLYPEECDKFITVLNGFDEKEVGINADLELEINNSYINFVFTGTFYEKALYLFDSFLNALKIINAENRLNNARFYFFGSNSKIIQNKVNGSGLERFFKFGNYSDISKVNWLITQSEYCLLFLTDDINYSFSTKFCEYIKLKRKIVVFSKPGMTGQFVSEHKLGVHIDLGNEYETMKLLLENKIKFPTNFDTNQFSLQKQTVSIADLIK